MDNTPTAVKGVAKCWGFYSNSAFTRWAKWPNAHGNFGEKNLHWTPACELLRRGGRNKDKLVAVAEINGRVQKLRGLHRREFGENISDGVIRTAGNGNGPETTQGAELGTEAAPEYELDDLRVNQAGPRPPCDFSAVAFVQLESASHQIQEATGERVEAEESLHGRA